MIPKTLHYCWFGQKPLPGLVKDCIESWKETNPDYTIVRWDEANTDLHMHPFVEKMYQEKKWAFVVDYVRLHVLYEHGGIYLDTDMKLVQSLDTLLSTDLLLGKESEEYISCGMIGAIPHHFFIEATMKAYDSLEAPRPNPLIMTEIFNTLHPVHALVMPPVAFYPFTSDSIKKYKGQVLSKETYGIHLWNYSWGHPLNRFFKKIGIYRTGKHIVEKLRLKKILKELLGFI